MKKVLLVEDEKFLLGIYETKLEKEGFVTVSLSSGVGVEEAAKKERPDIIILDLMMPERDGFETLKGLKTDQDLKKIPVIVITALGSPSDKKTCLDLGADDFLEKDVVSLQEIVEVVKNHVSI